MISLWVATAYLIKASANKMYSFLTALPATFMSAVSVTYILMAKEGFSLGSNIAYPSGIIFALVCFAVYIFILIKKN